MVGMGALKAKECHAEHRFGGRLRITSAMQVAQIRVGIRKQNAKKMRARAFILKQSEQ